jgi:hypothetical protein
MPPNRQLILIFMICAIAFGCATTRESTVRKYCKYIRPDMTLADANELIGWEAEVVDGSWYWTDKKRCIVQMNEGKIVSVSDFVRFKIYYKLLGKDGVYERDIQTEGSAGDPINQW